MPSVSVVRAERVFHNLERPLDFWRWRYSRGFTVRTGPYLWFVRW